MGTGGSKGGKRSKGGGGGFGGGMGDLFGDLLGGMGGMGGMGGGGMPGQGRQQPASGGSGVDLYTKESPVLRVGQLPSSSSERIWLLHFYSPTSEKSVALSKVWTKLAGGGYLPEVVQVGAVNCDKKPAVCEEASKLGALPVGFWVKGSRVPVNKSIM
jgi:hypothetical protein